MMNTLTRYTIGFLGHHHHNLRTCLTPYLRCNSNYSTVAKYSNYEHLTIFEPHPAVLHVQLNRPNKRNALTRDTFGEIQDCFATITADKKCRAVVLSGNGKMFCAGIDFNDFMQVITSGIGGDTSDNEDNGEQSSSSNRNDVAGKAKFLRELIAQLQVPFTLVKQCPKPVISAVHNGCIGVGLDLITATDVRYCTTDAYFSIREVAIGLAADVGTLQRLPKIVNNDSLVRELAFTGRNLPSSEAKQFGLVSGVYADLDSCIAGAIELATTIARKSPVAVQGTKIALNYSRDHTEAEGLEFMQLWNMSMLQTDDVAVAVGAVLSKDDNPHFSDL